jgi:hypothetical protein
MVEYMEIDGIGKVQVDSSPDKIPGKVLVGTKWVKIDKNLYKYLWALTHATEDDRKRLGNLL